MSQPQIINIPEIFKDFFACRNILAANHQYLENTQRLARSHNCLSRKSSKSRKVSKAFSPAELSQQQIIDIPEIFKDFVACRTVLAGSHRFPVIFKDFLSRKYSKTFRPKNFLSRKSTISRQYSKTFSPAELSYQQVIDIPEIFKDFSRLQNCLSRKPSISRKYSKTFLACRIVLAANNHYPEKTQRLLGLLNCLRPMSSVSRKYWKTSSPAELSQQQIINTPEIFKDFFACRNVLAANHQYPGNIQRLLRLQNCLSSKSSIPRKYSKTFSPAELPQPQIINIPEIFKDFFACRNVLAANHQYPGNIQRLLRLQNCLSSKSSIPRKYSKTFSPAELSQPQIINFPEIFKHFFACRIILAANNQYPKNTQRLFRLHNCLSRKSSISRKYSKTFSPAELSQQQISDIQKIFKDFSRLQNCLSRKSSIS